MLHAILIMAHSDLNLLPPLVQYFSKSCIVFIHIDKKLVIDDNTYSVLRSISWVRIVPFRFDVHWGGFSMLKAELILFKYVISNCDAMYLHLISGQDYPIKPLKYFLSFFDKNASNNYLEYTTYPTHEESNIIYSRGAYFLPYDRVNARTEKGFMKIKKWAEQQAKCGFVRQNACPYVNRYKGSQWLSLTCNVVRGLLFYANLHSSYLKSMQYTFAPEEIFIPTILVNEFPDTIINNNLRYIRWKGENGSNPSYLSINHFSSICHNSGLFARKICIPHSMELRNLIDMFLLNI